MKLSEKFEKNIARHVLLSVFVVSVVMLFACSDNKVSMVKNGTLQFDKSLTVGNIKCKEDCAMKGLFGKNRARGNAIFKEMQERRQV